MSPNRAACLLALALVSAPPAVRSQSYQLNSPDGERIVALDGVMVGDRAGYSVSGAGDFNGDGLADVIVGAYRAQRDGEAQGQAYVVFGSRDVLPARIDLGALDGTNGFVMRSPQPRDLMGMAVAGIGDFNGDGIDDIAIAAPSAETTEREAGRVIVLFGRRGSFDAELDLTQLEAGQGVVFDSPVRGEAGRAISGIGDFNGDGFADFAIGAPSTRNEYGASSGRVYVIFGGENYPLRFSLGVLERDGRGFALEGRREGDRAGWSVGGGGDINGSGFPDLLIGAPRMMNPKPLDTGEAYLIYGGRGPHVFDLSLHYLNGDNGSRITGYQENQWLGTSVAAIGDMRGNGVSEFLVGASKSWPGGRPDGVDEGGQVMYFAGMPGRQRVVFATDSPDTLRMNHLDGVNAGDFIGWSVAGVGDTDGDGIADFVVSAHAADPVDANAGRTYLIRGRRTTFLPNQSLRQFVTGQTEVYEGKGRWQIAGVSVSGVGDFNGDGVNDLIIGAPGGSATEGDQIGRAFLVLGERLSTPDEAEWKVWHAAGKTPLLGIGGPTDGRVYPPDARCWIGFDAGTGDGFQDASLTTVKRTSTVIPPTPEPDSADNFANVMWRLETARTDWESATIRLKWLDAEVQGLNAGDLRLVHRADESTEWQVVEGQEMDTERRRVTFTTAQLGDFALRAE